MAGRKYASDYRLEKQLSGNGRTTTTAVYQGDWYGFCQGPDVIRRLSWSVMLASAAVILLMMPLLCIRPNSIPISGSVFVLLPMAFVILFAVLVFMSGLRLHNFKEPLTREQKDQTDVRLRRNTVWLLVITGLHLAGCCVYAFTKGLQNLDWLVVLCTALEVVAAVFLLTQRKKAETKVTKKAEKKEKPKKDKSE